MPRTYLYVAAPFLLCICSDTTSWTPTFFFEFLWILCPCTTRVLHSGYVLISSWGSPWLSSCSHLWHLYLTQTVSHHYPQSRVMPLSLQRRDIECPFWRAPLLYLNSIDGGETKPAEAQHKCLVHHTSGDCQHCCPVHLTLPYIHGEPHRGPRDVYDILGG